MSFYEDRIFPIVLDIALAGVKDTRQSIIASAEGRVLEVGIGNGANLPFYTYKATEVVGIEPCEAMVGMAQKKVDKLAAESTSFNSDKYMLHVGGGEALEFEDNSFDTVVACLVFCTIPEAEAAAKEMYRVLKPGGTLLFFEHVRSPKSFMSSIQKALNPLWKPFACGCHLTRDTQSLFSGVGFEYSDIREYSHPKMFNLFANVIKGKAIKPA